MKIITILVIASSFSSLSVILAEKCKSTEPECNGSSKLCNRSYNMVSFPCTHNSYSYPPPGSVPGLNQQHTIEQQLNDGVRAFMLDVMRPGSIKGSLKRAVTWVVSILVRQETTLDDVHLCHGSCELVDRGKFVDVLRIFKEFIDENPNEVITFIIENTSSFLPEELHPSFSESGLDKYAFTPNFEPSPNHQNYTWPTLGQLIEQRTPLVVFMDNNTDTTKVPYILPEWEYVIETPYANVHPVKEFPCNQDRPKDNIPRDLLVVNHFAYKRLNIGEKHIDMPLTASELEAAKYNTYEYLAEHIEGCKAQWGNHIPNFITMDYYNVGNSSLFDIVNDINGI